MEKRNDEKIQNAFSARAAKYETEASWILNEKFIEPLVPKVFGSGRLLDVCAGTGIVAKYAQSNGWSVAAADISEAMLKHIPAPIEKVLASVESLPFDEKSFDVVTCRQGLHYVDDLGHALLSMAKVAKSKIILGHIVIFDERDVGFWTNYYNVAKTGRRHVFYSGMLSEKINALGIKQENVRVMTCWESLLGPMSHLDDGIKNILRNMLVNTDEDFKARNHIAIDNGTIISERKWEIIEITP